MTHISIDLPDDLAERLSRIAAETQSTTEDLILRAVRASVAAQDELEAMIAQGEADVAAGRVVAFEDGMREVDAIIAAGRARKA